jgi:hypothetical protein
MDGPSVPVDMPLAGLEKGMKRRRASLCRYAESWNVYGPTSTTALQLYVTRYMTSNQPR